MDDVGELQRIALYKKGKSDIYTIEFAGNCKYIKDLEGMKIRGSYPIGSFMEILHQIQMQNGESDPDRIIVDYAEKKIIIYNYWME